MNPPLSKFFNREQGQEDEEEDEEEDEDEDDDADVQNVSWNDLLVSHGNKYSAEGRAKFSRHFLSTQNLTPLKRQMALKRIPVGKTAAKSWNEPRHFFLDLYAIHKPLHGFPTVTRFPREKKMFCSRTVPKDVRSHYFSYCYSRTTGTSTSTFFLLTFGSMQ